MKQPKVDIPAYALFDDRSGRFVVIDGAAFVLTKMPFMATATRDVADLANRQANLVAGLEDFAEAGCGPIGDRPEALELHYDSLPNMDISDPVLQAANTYRYTAGNPGPYKDMTEDEVEQIRLEATEAERAKYTRMANIAKNFKTVKLSVEFV